VLLRTGEIFGQVAAHGFGSLLDRGEHRRRARSVAPEGLPSTDRTWVRVRLLLEALGPTFVKMGQMFSNRPDLLPEELLIELRKLQDSVPGFALDKVRLALEDQYGKPLEEVFASFDPVPVASASVAQVHAARLADGRRVAVKVLRPHIEDIIATDLEILAHVGPWFERLILRSDVLDTKAIIQEFSRNLLKELDFRQEALYLERFAALFEGDPDILVPRVYRSLSGPRVLVMDFIEGLHPLDWDGYARAGLNRKAVAEKGVRLLLKQVFVHGFFHADPHTGNLLILPDGRICFLDFGLMGQLPPRHREKLEQMLVAVSQSNGPALAAALLALGNNGVPADHQAFEDDVEALLAGISHIALARIDLTDFLEKAVSLLLTHRLALPANLYLLVKALLTIEGFGRLLDPELDFVALLEPFLRANLTSRLDPLKAGTRGAESALGYLSLAADLPAEVRTTLQHLRQGKLKLEFQGDDLEKILHKADKISNRIAFSLIVTGALLASSLALQSKIPPLWNDIPVIAIVGFMGSFLLGFALLISIWRSGRF
jgi:ubiquinone biosynthesis protein